MVLGGVCSYIDKNMKRFDVHFLADTFGINASQVSHIFDTWITFLSKELSFLVPWPSRSEMRKVLPERFKRCSNIRVIIDLYPIIPPTKKTTLKQLQTLQYCKVAGWYYTNWGHFLYYWTGNHSDKKMVRNSDLIDHLEEGDAVMVDKGFLVRDLLAFKKVKLISPAYCRGPRFSSNAAIHTLRVAALRSHVERFILRLKHFGILSSYPTTNEDDVEQHIFCMCSFIQSSQQAYKLKNIIEYIHIEDYLSKKSVRCFVIAYANGVYMFGRHVLSQ